MEFRRQLITWGLGKRKIIGSWGVVPLRQLNSHIKFAHVEVSFVVEALRTTAFTKSHLNSLPRKRTFPYAAAGTSMAHDLDLSFVFKHL